MNKVRPQNLKRKSPKKGLIINTSSKKRETPMKGKRRRLKWTKTPKKKISRRNHHQRRIMIRMKML
jgi:hypothetical protein